MEMCYDGALVMPSNYTVMSEDEMTYVEGGKTLSITLKKSTIQAAIGTIVGAVTGVAITVALDSLAVAIAASIEVGTAGLATLTVGAFLLAWHGWAAQISAGIAGSIVGAGASKLYKGGSVTFKRDFKGLKKNRAYSF